MDLGRIEFCGSDANCNVAGNIACAVFDFVQLIIAFKSLCKMQISLKAFAFDEKDIKIFKDNWVRISKDGKRMKIDRRISNAKQADGDEFENIFEKY